MSWKDILKGPQPEIPDEQTLSTPVGQTGETQRVIWGTKVGDQAMIDDLTRDGKLDGSYDDVMALANAAGASAAEEHPTHVDIDYEKAMAEQRAAAEEQRAEIDAAKAAKRARKAGAEESDSERARDRAWVSALAHAGYEGFKEASSRTKRTTGWVALAAVLGGGGFAVAAFSPKGAEAKGCDDMTHVSIGTGNVLGFGIVSARDNLNRAWPNIAEEISSQRGYAVAWQDLAAENSRLKVDGQKVVAKDKDGQISEDVNVDGSAAMCLEVPAPVPIGTAVMTGEMTASGFMDYYGLSEEKFFALNPKFNAGFDKPLPAGTRLNWGRYTGGRLATYVLQEVPAGGTKKISDHKPAVRDAIAQANSAIYSNGETTKAGDEAYLPHGKFTVSIDGKEKQVTYSALVKAYKQADRADRKDGKKAGK